MGAANEAAQAILARSGGEGDAMARCARFVETVYGEYRVHLDHYYRMEQRWPGAPFWARRLEA